MLYLTFCYCATKPVRSLEEKGYLYVIRTIKHPNTYVLDESLFKGALKSFKTSPILNNESKNEGLTPKESQSHLEFENNDSNFASNESLLACRRCRAKVVAQGEPLASSHSSSAPSQEYPHSNSFSSPSSYLTEEISYSLYPQINYLPMPEEGKTPANEAFGITKLLLVMGKEDISICSLTVYELSQSILELYGLRILQEIKKLCFKYSYFGMSFHKLHWLCKEVYERRNPFEVTKAEYQQKEFIERKKQEEQKKNTLEEEIQKRYLVSQYEQKKQEETRAQSQNGSLMPEVDSPAENPLESFRRILMTISFPFYQGPEDRLMECLNRLPPVTLRMFRNEYERLPRERFEGYMKAFIIKQFGSGAKNDMEGKMKS